MSLRTLNNKYYDYLQYDTCTYNTTVTITLPTVLTLIMIRFNWRYLLYTSHVPEVLFMLHWILGVEGEGQRKEKI